MTYFVSDERRLIRRAVGVMHDSALDELSDQELEYMYPPNLRFIAAALESMTNEMHQGTGITESFTEFELTRVAHLLSVINEVLTETGTPRSIISDSIELSDMEVKMLFDERDELQRRGNAVATRLAEIDLRISRSGESKYRRSLGAKSRGA